MRQSLLAIFLFAVTLNCFGQHGKTYSSIGGFGNVLYPGTGHAPNVNPNPVPFPARLGGVISGSPFNPPRMGHPAHNRSTFVPYPVIVGGYGYGGGYYGGYADQPPPEQQYQQDAPPPIFNSGVPSVVINQTFIPDHAVPMVREYNGDSSDGQASDQPGMRVYEGLKTPQYNTPPPAAARKVADDQPTLYLIAMKDHTIVQALGYWVEKGSLHYVSAEHSLNQASLDLIDRDLTQRLNDERNIDFKLPKND